MSKFRMSFFLWGSLLLYSKAEAQSFSTTVGGISSTPTKISPAGVFWNPALIGMTSGTQIETNLTLTGGWLIYDRTGNDPNTGLPYKSSEMSALAPIPFVAVNSPLGTKDFRFGYATYFPGGVMASYDPNGSQRYNITEGVVIPWHHQMTLAYKPDPDWSIALAGIYSMGFFSVEAGVDMESFISNVTTNAKDLPKEHKSLSATAKIPLTMGHAYGGALGVFYSPNYQWGFGFAVFSPVKFKFHNRLNLEIPKTINSLSVGLRAMGLEDNIISEVEATTTLPPFVNLGMSYQPYGYYTFELFGRYVFGSLYPSVGIQITDSPLSAIKNYSRPGKPMKDNFLIGHVSSFSLWQHWTLGLNTSYTNNSVADKFLSTSLADFDTYLVGVFAQLQWTDRLKIGAEYAHSFMVERTASGTQAASTATNSMFRAVSSDGEYRAAADRVGVSVKYAF